MYIENDVSGNQHAINSNFQTIVNTLGGDIFQIRCPRISCKDECKGIIYESSQTHYKRRNRDNAKNHSDRHETNRNNEYGSNYYRYPGEHYESKGDLRSSHYEY